MFQDPEVPMSAKEKRSVAAKKAAKTRADVKQSEEDAEHAQEAGDNLTNSGHRSAAKYVEQVLKQPDNELLCYRVKELLVNGNLKTMLMGKQMSEEEKELKKLTPIRQQIKKFEHMTKLKFMYTAFIKAMEPDLASTLLGSRYAAGDLVMFALGVSPEAYLPNEFDEGSKYLEHMLPHIVDRYKAMGSRLRGGTPRTLRYWTLFPEEGMVEFRVLNEAIKFKLQWTAENWPADIELVDPDRVGAYVVVKTWGIQRLELLSVALLVPEEELGLMQQHLVSETAVWKAEWSKSKKVAWSGPSSASSGSPGDAEPRSKKAKMNTMNSQLNRKESLKADFLASMKGDGKASLSLS